MEISNTPWPIDTQERTPSPIEREAALFLCRSGNLLLQKAIENDGLVVQLLSYSKHRKNKPEFTNCQYSETNLMHFLLNLFRTKGLYIFRALLTHPQDSLHKRHLVYCVRVMSVGYYQRWSGTLRSVSSWFHYTVILRSTVNKTLSSLIVYFQWFRIPYVLILTSDYCIHNINNTRSYLKRSQIQRSYKKMKFKAAISK
jgi:hypothetical protein